MHVTIVHADLNLFFSIPSTIYLATSAASRLILGHYRALQRLGDWDYLPGSHATHPLQDRPFTAEELKYIQANEGLIGTKYDKVRGTAVRLMSFTFLIGI